MNTSLTDTYLQGAALAITLNLHYDPDDTRGD